MKILKTLFLLVFAGILFTACSPTYSPFTQQLYDKNRWSENELKKIQFYLSDDIIMQREISGGASEIISGEIKMINGKEVIKDGRLTTLEIEPVIERHNQIARKMVNGE